MQYGANRQEADLGELEDLLAQRTRELGESEARFRTLFDGIPETVWVHDRAGVILLCNEIGARKLERRADELAGKVLRDLFVEDDVERVLAAIVLAATHGMAAFEASCIAPSGRRITLAVNCRAIEFEGQPAVLSVARDVTEERNAGRQRADFIAMIAHDIRNPLSVVVGYADMIREMGGLDGEKDDMLARLVTNTRSVISLVSNYLDLSRIEANRLVLNNGRVDMNLVLQTVADLYRDEARRKEIGLEMKLQRGLPPLRGDAMALERVFGNLVHNALKYTPARGSVTIASDSSEGSVFASVIDTGPGIPAEEVSTIFDRYRRTFTGRAQHGSGLGLFIAKALVEAQGGTLTVDTQVGRGSLFRVALPERQPL